MENLKYLIDAFFLLFDHDMTIWGYTFSFFDIFLFSLFVGFIGVALGNLFRGDD